MQTLEVTEFDLKRQLVYELDVNVLRCVRDQNGPESCDTTLYRLCFNIGNWIHNFCIAYSRSAAYYVTGNETFNNSIDVSVRLTECIFTLQRKSECYEEEIMGNKPRSRVGDMIVLVQISVQALVKQVC
ncbi:hypothetical protein C5167_035483 [Papaver somniferum]|uniref:Uncharacterized protein n=1 Tax=Papaver somniferum TaxID=3469 RepID=A0A4Y7KJ98_PAPSO|nr:hypothetical protein C5167_035483 [Papaver somniferum]